MILKRLKPILKKIDPVSIILLIVVITVFVWRAAPPGIEAMGSIRVRSLEGAEIDIEREPRRRVIVFWATWCGPCTVELTRLQMLINRGLIDPSAVLAISSHEERDVVDRTAREKQYTFQIALDPSGETAAKVGVRGTPTIFLVEPDGSIHWGTVGVSPTLEIRVAKFLNL